MRALVTGGTGFVGSHVVRTLAQAEHEVRVLHRSTSRLDALAGVTYESVLGDILDAEALRVACDGCDWVFHVAAVADYWRADVDKLFDANVRGTQLVLQAARDAGVRRVVFTSSAAAIGPGAYGQPAGEDDTFNRSPKQFPYGYSKVLAERAVAEAVAAGQDVVTVNPVVVVGPGDLNLISGDFVVKTRRLSWLIPVPPGGVAVTDVRDIARWQVRAAEVGETGQRYILGTANYPYHFWFATIADVVGVPRPALPIPASLLPLMASVIDLARQMGIRMPVDANQTRLGAEFIYFQFDKAWQRLGEPQISMRNSLEDTYVWYRDHGYIREDWVARLVGAFNKRR
ncbi:MAG: NAD-dependent epimerase/dehydratase family protein [Anaerolineae bacterium]|nr:NAD-dependent epimerase/dehydratase family protein [Anaerolineae bacterium]